MTDDVKAAIEAVRQWSLRSDATFAPPLAVMQLLECIDGEPARIAAAVAAATKEFRDKQALWDEDASFYLQTLRQADRIAELEAESRECIETCVRSGLKERRTLLETVGGAVHDVGLHKSIAANWRARAEKAEAERDALRARVFEVEQRQVGYVLVSFASHEQWKAELAELGALRARLDALYGVILFAHAFAEAEPLVSGYVRLHGHILHLREIHALARAATQAMDEAKP